LVEKRRGRQDVEGSASRTRDVTTEKDETGKRKTEKGKERREKRKAEHRVHKENLEGTEKPDTTKAGYRPFVR
jgi:hypothetical protein